MLKTGKFEVIFSSRLKFGEGFALGSFYVVLGYMKCKETLENVEMKQHV